MTGRTGVWRVRAAVTAPRAAPTRPRSLAGTNPHTGAAHPAPCTGASPGRPPSPAVRSAGPAGSCLRCWRSRPARRAPGAGGAPPGRRSPCQRRSGGGRAHASPTAAPPTPPQYPHPPQGRPFPAPAPRGSSPSAPQRPLQGSRAPSCNGPSPLYHRRNVPSTFTRISLWSTPPPPPPTKAAQRAIQTALCAPQSIPRTTHTCPLPWYSQDTVA
ncbi:hypothetical protein NDU88_005835 [Pleurodeles waltl]|uniref:Uncharacterized protein n=1 Tax=Pleurodeles waltl TaxID=8319 RepID=A0AAV7RM70_PLEWA|nr:hypothetical protein NDU88_005835 [Pleurodeles waltl]